MNIAILARLIVEYIRIITPFAVSTNVMATILNHANLKKLSKTGYIINNKIPKPDEIEKPSKREINQKVYEYVLPYIEKLQKYTSEDNLQTLYRNIETCKIKRQSLLTGIYYTGLYSPKKNEIKCLTKRAFGHELLHLASSYYDPETKISYAGFRQYKEKASIGRGLNEGYTELLASRLYNKNNKVEAYKKEARIARLFEFFFDNPKEMEKYYFNHDLPGIIHHMEKFSSRQDVINLILDVDKITEFENAFGNPLPTINSVKLEVQLFDWYSHNCTNKRKVEEFRKVVCENKLAEIILDNRNTTIRRTQPQQLKTAMAR